MTISNDPQTAMETQQPVMVRNLGELDQAIKYLYDKAELLKERLNPILTPAPPTNVNPEVESEAEVPSRGPMSFRVSAMVKDVRNVGIALQDLIDNLNI